MKLLCTTDKMFFPPSLIFYKVFNNFCLYATSTWEYFHQIWKTHLYEENGKAFTTATNSFTFFGVELTAVLVIRLKFNYATKVLKTQDEQGLEAEPMIFNRSVTWLNHTVKRNIQTSETQQF